MTNREEPTLETALNETLRLLMTRTGKRQVDLAEAIGIKRASVSQRLLGNSRWAVNDLPKVAEVFGLTVSELLSGYAALAQSNRLPPAKNADGQTRI